MTAATTSSSFTGESLERVERLVVRRHRAPGESDSSTQKLAALVEHALFDNLVRTQQQRLRDREAERLRGLEIDD